MNSFFRRPNTLITESLGYKKIQSFVHVKKTMSSRHLITSAIKTYNKCPKHKLKTRRGQTCTKTKIHFRDTAGHITIFN